MAEVNQQIGDYKLRQLLGGGSGQVSQVFEVVETRSNRHFAMKILLPKFSNDSKERGTLFHEAKVGQKMRHENVINVVKVVNDECPYFVMEYFPSGSIRNRMLSKDPRDKEFLKVNAKKIFKQVATGLAYMNANKYVHCDIKPDNILSNALAQTKIIDFAISRPIAGGFFGKLLASKPKKPQGTPSYMSPEQIRCEHLDSRSDIYNYGATLYDIVAGRPPFRGDTINALLNKHLSEKALTPQAYNGDVTDEFGEFVLKLLAKDKTKRPENFHEVLMALKKVSVYKSLPDKGDD